MTKSMHKTVFRRETMTHVWIVTHQSWLAYRSNPERHHLTCRTFICALWFLSYVWWRKKGNKSRIFKFAFLSFWVGYRDSWDIFNNSIETFFVCKCFGSSYCGYHRATSIPEVEVTIFDPTHLYMESTIVHSDKCSNTGCGNAYLRSVYHDRGH